MQILALATLRNVDLDRMTAFVRNPAEMVEDWAVGVVLPFCPRPQRLTGPAIVRAQIKEAAQAALDTAYRPIAILEKMDGAPNTEPLQGVP